MEKTKKAFQNVVAKIRKETGDQFPKAMMTRQQMNKATATVNCGGEFKGTESSKELAEKVLNDERFNEFLKKNEAAALVEAVNIAGKTVYQVRVLFEGYGEDEFVEEVAQQLEDEENEQEYLDAVNDLINEESTAEETKIISVSHYTNKKGKTYDAHNMISKSRAEQMQSKGYTYELVNTGELAQEAYDRLSKIFDTVRIYSQTTRVRGYHEFYAMCK